MIDNMRTACRGLNTPDLQLNIHQHNILLNDGKKVMKFNAVIISKYLFYIRITIRAKYLVSYSYLEKI